jgi:hypothetical protein
MKPLGGYLLHLEVFYPSEEFSASIWGQGVKQLLVKGNRHITKRRPLGRKLKGR